MTAEPYLSVVAASRNDDHGGDPLIRTQIFINSFSRQCQKYGLPAELIIVDWNPVAGRPGLAAVLGMPPETHYVSARAITVPPVLHRRLKYAEQQPFFQMIAKNVGIRRSNGQFILATNIDILFSDELIEFIAKRRLDPAKQYRVDRYDIESGLEVNATLEDTMTYAWSHPIRAHRRYQPQSLVEHLYGNELFKRSCTPDRQFQGKHEGVEVLQNEGIWQVRPERFADMNLLHTNACGDFTLLSRQGWSEIRGYPEFEAFSFNIDSVGIVAAHYSGYQEVALLPPCVCFHIEHGLGSGWTPEGEKQLFKRLEKAGILSPEWPVLMPLVEEMKTQQKALEFNNPNWGLAGIDLPERMLGDCTPISDVELNKLFTLAETHPISSLEPAYDLDKLTLLHERRYGALVLGAHVGRVTFYIPHSDGGYSEEHSVSEYIRLFQRSSVEFYLNEFSNRRRLRFDPCQCPGIVTIYSITVLDKNKKVAWKLEGRNMGKLKIAGTATGVKENWMQKRFRSRDHVLLISTGLDPQLILPRLPKDIAFPIVVSVELKVAPSQ